MLDLYVGNSLLSDVRLLSGSDPRRSLDGHFQNRAVVTIGYEHDPPEADLDEILAAIEILAQHLYGVTLGKRVEETRSDLVHGVYQRGRCVGWLVKENRA